MTNKKGGKSGGETTTQAKAEYVYYADEGDTKARGHLKTVRHGVSPPFFSQAVGLQFLKSAVEQGVIGADDAPFAIP